ncbi:tripartite tricarboxylate transporter substrate binding protein [soil metagenome]
MQLDRRSILGASAILSLSPLAAFAQQKFPSKPIRFVSPAAPGGLSDTLPRVLATDLAAAMGTQVVVENRAGAGGSIATAAVASGPADGYTLLLGTGGTMTLNPYFLSNLPYDTKKDFVGLALVAFTPLYLVVRPDSPYRSIDDLVAAAKKAPGTLAYGTLGNGSTAAIAAAMLAKSKGLELIDIPYAGYAPALTELLAGRLAFALVDGSSLARIEGGSLRALAVTTAQRAPRVASVPTLKELGVDIQIAVWFGVYARSGSPADALQALRTEVQHAVQKPEFRAQLTTFGLEPGNLFGEEFQKFHLNELKRLGETLPTLGIKGLV